MKSIIPLALTIPLLLFANHAMADRGYGRSNHDPHLSQAQRAELRLDTKGDRIERRFAARAAHAAAHGKYRQARHFRNQGEQINRHLDRKGQRIQARLEQRGECRQERHHHNQSFPRVAYPVPGQRHHDNYVSVMIQQPGLWLGWGMHH